MKNKKTKRPIVITILCVYIFISTLFLLFGSILILFYPSTYFIVPYAKRITNLDIFLGFIYSILYLVSLAYIWQMKKFGLKLYVLTTIFGYIFGLIETNFSLSNFSLFGFIVQVIIVLGKDTTHFSV